LNRKIMTKKDNQRVETDQFGEVHIPAGAYWGCQTARAREAAINQPDSSRQHLLDALLMIKKAAAIANFELGTLELITSRSIRQCCDEIISGQFRDQFLTDRFVGSGSCLVDNINEVLANRANETLGGKIGQFEYVHPIDHVNLNQTNDDIYPSAIRIAILLSMRDLELVLLDLERLLRRKSLEFERIVKVGRISLRDSLPVTLGQEFNAYATAIEKALRQLKEAASELLEINLGAAYVGSGLGTSLAFADKTLNQLRQLTGLPIRLPDDYFRITQSMADYVRYASALKLLALELVKIGNDLRLLNSGPSGGLGEIKMPTQISQVMPAPLSNRKNHILLNSLIMASFQVISNENTVSLCAQGGQLESNPNLPLIAESILGSIELLQSTLQAFNQKCLSLVTADQAHCRRVLLNSENVALILIEHIGEEKAVQILSESARSGKTIEELVLQQNLMTREAFEKSMYLRPLTRPGQITPGKHNTREPTT
jgi:aspartate ammonia-lyase